jgi:tRNA A64-2'-O-ribosylphosphate transferase
VRSLVASDSTHSSDNNASTFKPAAVEQVHGRIQICCLSDLPSPLLWEVPPYGVKDQPEDTHCPEPAAYILIASSRIAVQVSEDQAATPSCPPVMRLRLDDGKKGQDHFLRSILPRSMAFIREQLECDRTIVIACSDGKDASVGVAVAAIQTFFNEDGKLSFFNQPGMLDYHVVVHARSPLYLAATKNSIRTKLQWVISNRPEANPSRATLKRVNEFLLSPTGFRAWQTINT